MKLQYKSGEQEASQVTVHYDGQRENLEIDENGLVEVENQKQAEELVESHGGFDYHEEDAEPEEKLPDYVLADKNVGEVEDYVSNIHDVERLQELRELEGENLDRSTAIQHIDEQIAEVQEPEEEEEQEDNEEEQEESEDENQGEQEESEDVEQEEDGEGNEGEEDAGEDEEDGEEAEE